MSEPTAQDLQQEFQELSAYAAQIGNANKQITDAVNSGDLDMSLAAHQRMNLQESAAHTRNRMAQIDRELTNLRDKEIEGLRAEIPGWKDDQKYQAASKQLQKFARERGCPEDYLRTASMHDIRTLEELRQAKTSKGRGTDFDAASVNPNYEPEIPDLVALEEKSGIPAHVLESMKPKDREWMTIDLGDPPMEKKETSPNR